MMAFVFYPINIVLRFCIGKFISQKRFSSIFAICFGIRIII